jgi:hypothetical protein
MEALYYLRAFLRDPKHLVAVIHHRMDRFRILGIFRAQGIDDLPAGLLARVALFPFGASEADVVVVIDLSLSMHKLRNIQIGIKGHEHVSDIQNHVPNHKSVPRDFKFGIPKQPLRKL